MFIEMVAKIADGIGLLGVILLLIGYFLLNMNILMPSSIKYQLLNLFGALFILISLFFAWNLSAFVIETAWVLISLIGIYRAMRTA